MGAQSSIPKSYRQDIRRATEILKGFGCTDVFLFGSLAAGQRTPQSDIDLAVRGCPHGKFFKVLAKLMLELDYPVDLVSLDRGDAFGRFLEREGELVKVG